MHLIEMLPVWHKFKRPVLFYIGYIIHYFETIQCNDTHSKKYL